MESKNLMKKYICLLKKEHIPTIEYRPSDADKDERTLYNMDVFLGIMEAPDTNTAGVLIAKKYNLDWRDVHVIDCADPKNDVVPELILTNPYPSGGDCHHYEVITRGIRTLGQLLDIIRETRPCDKFGMIVLKYGPFGLNEQTYNYNFEAGQAKEDIGIPNNALEAEIQSVSASGGWGSMTYYVRLKTQKGA